MRRTFFITLVIFPLFCWSQTYIGVKSGYSPASKIAFNPDLNATSFFGEMLGYGIVLKQYDNKWVGFQGELNITQRGYYTPFQDTCKLLRVNNYVEMPMLFQLHIKLSEVYLHVNLGCFAAYLLSAKQGVDTTGTMVLKQYKFNILRDNRFDNGLIWGAGLSHEFGWGDIQVEIRILYGLSDLYKHTYSGMPKQSRTIVQNVSLSYMYNFSKLSQKRKKKVN